MHKLQRGHSPACLAKFQHGVNTWGDLDPLDKTAIWAELEAMQGSRCAYCEASINEDRRHIEHFRQRRSYPQDTFAWDNLFGSCMRPGTCGDHKDKCGTYKHTDLIKPDVENPESFLVFSPHGSVAPRAGLNATDRQRAEETIRILNLNGALRQIRQSEVIGYIQTAEEFAEMAAQYPESDWLPLLGDELAAIAHLPFATAIKHVLTRQS